MGPPPFSDGNPRGINRGVCLANLLRSFSGLLGMETPEESTEEFAEVDLQWGHRLSAMETTLDLTNSLALVTPSMGPPPFSDGNLLYQNWDLVVLTFLQWGHRLSAMETGGDAVRDVPDIRPSMGPPPFSDGNRHLLPAPGAGRGPSMGPPPFSDGNRGTSWSLTLQTAAFNGATAFQRWKLLGVSSLETNVRYLQWGHRLSAMETHRRRVEEKKSCQTFNGATAFQRWKT